MLVEAQPFTIINMSTPVKNDSGSMPIKLYCFHDAGGNHLLYRDWEALLGPQLEVQAVELPCRDGKLDKNFPSSLEFLIETLADKIISESKQSFAFFGHSMGTVISFLLAVKLWEKQGPLPQHLFLSAFSPPVFWPNYITTVSDIAKKLVSQMNAVLHSVLYNDLKLLTTFTNLTPYFNISLDVPITVFIGESDNFINPTIMQDWSKHTKKTFNLHVITGDHFYLQKDNVTIIQPIKNYLIG